MIIVCCCIIWINLQESMFQVWLKRCRIHMFVLHQMDHVYSLSCLTRIGSKAALSWHTLGKYKVQNVEAARQFRSCNACSETMKSAAQLLF